MAPFARSIAQPPADVLAAEKDPRLRANECERHVFIQIFSGCRQLGCNIVIWSISLEKSDRFREEASRDDITCD